MCNCGLVLVEAIVHRFSELQDRMASEYAHTMQFKSSSTFQITRLWRRLSELSNSLSCCVKFL